MHREEARSENGARPRELDLTFVIPMYNESEIARAAVDRTLRVGHDLGRPFEVLAVDDGSTDSTAQVLAELRATRENFRWVQLQRNCGQPDATKAGMLAARGATIAVVDADLQMPPEVVPQLLIALEDGDPHVAAVFGVTSTRQRDDPLRLLIGQAVFYFLETRFGRHRIPHGASSFFVMRRDVARRVGSLPFRSGNIGAVLAALGVEMGTVSYVKSKSARDESRLGLRGHVDEAIASLALTGVFSQCARTGVGVASVVGAWKWTRHRRLSTRAVGAAALFASVLLASHMFVTRSLELEACADLLMVEGGIAAQDSCEFAAPA